MCNETHIALLRGINVGGKNRLPMKDLAALFERVGCRDVQTYIQSGNVIFQASATLARRIPTIISDEIQHTFRITVPVITRTARQWAQIVRRNPFQTDGVNPESLHVGFLRDRPTRRAVASLDPDRSPPDRFRVIGSEIYFCFPNGLARTRLTAAYFDSRLKTVCTVRNWNTMVKIAELLRGR